MKRPFVFSLMVLVWTTVSAHSECIEVRVITWNMESGGSDADTVAKQMAAKGKIDIWGLSEVQNQATLNIFQNAIEQATGLDYVAKLSTKGGSDRLAILYRADVFKHVGDFFEITSIQIGNPGLRPGFAVQLEGKRTGQRFFFVVNHFKCCGGNTNSNRRIKQAKALNAFVHGTNLPVLAVGDYNSPFNVFTQKTPAAIKTLTTNGGPFEWIKPEADNLARTEDSHPSILDYILVANKIEGWSGRSVILRRDLNIPAKRGDPFPDDSKTTDHRPILAVFTMNCEDRIEALEEEIALTEARLKMLRTELERLKENNNP